MKFKLFLVFLCICVWSIDIQSVPNAKLYIPSPGKGKVDIFDSEKSDFIGNTMNELMKRANITLTNSTSKLSNSLAMPSFINEMVKTDPNKVKPIVKLLIELIVHINTEVKSFKDGMNQAQQILVNAKAAHEDAKGKAKEAKEGEDSAKTKKDQAQTKYDDAKTAYDTNKPVLLKHVEIVQSVIDKLKLLYSSDKDQWEFVVNVTNGTTKIDRNFWNGICAKFGEVTGDSIMKLTMGDYVDYFKPLSSESFCKFILGKTWVHGFKESGPYDVPPSGVYKDVNHFGGSAGTEGERCHLPFWGKNSVSHSGCCVSKKGQCAWGQPFSMELKK